jgi:hypothetical protein
MDILGSSVRVPLVLEAAACQAWMGVLGSSIRMPLI